jgi:hypothetical protein
MSKRSKDAKSAGEISFKGKSDISSEEDKLNVHDSDQEQLDQSL